MADTVRTSFNTVSIKKTINDIDKRINELIKQGKTQAFDIEMVILEEMPEFYDEYPFLVKRLCKRENNDFLFKMLDSLEAVDKGNKSLATTELNLGEELASKYLYPVVGKNTNTTNE
jgi:hypothetical protein